MQSLRKWKTSWSAKAEERRQDRRTHTPYARSKPQPQSGDLEMQITGGLWTLLTKGLSSSSTHLNGVDTTVLEVKPEVESEAEPIVHKIADDDDDDDDDEKAAEMDDDDEKAAEMDNDDEKAAEMDDDDEKAAEMDDDDEKAAEMDDDTESMENEAAASSQEEGEAMVNGVEVREVEQSDDDTGQSGEGSDMSDQDGDEAIEETEEEEEKEQTNGHLDLAMVIDSSEDEAETMAETSRAAPVSKQKSELEPVALNNGVSKAPQAIPDRQPSPELEIAAAVPAVIELNVEVDAVPSSTCAPLGSANGATVVPTFSPVFVPTEPKRKQLIFLPTPPPSLPTEPSFDFGPAVEATASTSVSKDKKSASLASVSKEDKATSTDGLVPDDTAAAITTTTNLYPVVPEISTVVVPETPAFIIRKPEAPATSNDAGPSAASLTLSRSGSGHVPSTPHGAGNVFNRRRGRAPLLRKSDSQYDAYYKSPAALATSASFVSIADKFSRGPSFALDDSPLVDPMEQLYQFFREKKLRGDGTLTPMEIVGVTTLMKENGILVAHEGDGDRPEQSVISEKIQEMQLAVESGTAPKMVTPVPPPQSSALSTPWRAQPSPRPLFYPKQLSPDSKTKEQLKRMFGTSRPLFRAFNASRPLSVFYGPGYGQQTIAALRARQRALPPPAPAEDRFVLAQAPPAESLFSCSRISNTSLGDKRPLDESPAPVAKRRGNGSIPSPWAERLVVLNGTKVTSEAGSLPNGKVAHKWGMEDEMEDRAPLVSGSVRDEPRKENIKAPYVNGNRKEALKDEVVAVTPTKTAQIIRDIIGDVATPKQKLDDSVIGLLNPYQLGSPLKKAKPLLRELPKEPPKEPLIRVSHRPVTRSITAAATTTPAKKDEPARPLTALEMITKTNPKHRQYVSTTTLSNASKVTTPAQETKAPLVKIGPSDENESMTAAKAYAVPEVKKRDFAYEKATESKSSKSAAPSFNYNPALKSFPPSSFKTPSPSASVFDITAQQPFYKSNTSPTLATLTVKALSAPVQSPAFAPPIFEKTSVRPLAFSDMDMLSEDVANERKANDVIDEDLVKERVTQLDVTELEPEIAKYKFTFSVQTNHSEIQRSVMAEPESQLPTHHFGATLPTSAPPMPNRSEDALTKNDARNSSSKLEIATSATSDSWNSVFFNPPAPPLGSWTCSICMITNKPEAPKCAACENDKPDSKPMSKVALVTSGKWTCLVCMINNEAEASKCAACKSDKPSASKPVSSQSGFKADKATSGKWTCSVCMINNEAEASKCAACESDKPGASKPVSEPVMPSFNWSQSGFKDKATSGKWTCSVCMINNEAELSKCAACESDKPGTSKPVSESVVPSFNWSQSGFKADKATSGKWTCSVCMINNEAEASKCAACETDKPGAAKPVSEPVVPSFNWSQSGFKADKATSGKWTCSVCMINNDTEASKCAACETDKPGATKPASEPAAPSFNWSQSGFKMDKSTGSKWTCDVCMINNEAEASKCAACETDKSGGSSSFKTTATGTSLPTASTDNDKFGSVKRSSSGFAFGSSSLPIAPTSFTGGFSLASTNSAAAVPGGFSFKVSTANSKSSGATFGASSDTTVSGSSLAPSPFTFVVPNTTATSTLGTTTAATASPAFGVSAFRGSNVGAPSVFGGSTDGSTVFGFGMGTGPSTPFGGAAPMPSPTKLASPVFGSLSGFGNSTFGTSVFGASASTSAFGASSGFGSSSPFGGNVGTGPGTGFGFGGTIAQSSDWQSNNREPGSDDDL